MIWNTTEETLRDTIKKQYDLICRQKTEYTELLEENRKLYLAKIKRGGR